MKRTLVIAFGLACSILFQPLLPAQQETDTVVQPPESSVLDQTEVAPQVSPSDLTSPQELQAPATRYVPADVHAVPVNIGCCDPCHCRKVETTLCLTDCNGCEHEVCVRVPCCCVDHAPVVKWRDGILGRQIAIVCWECCDYSVKVIVNAHGCVRVRYHYLID